MLGARRQAHGFKDIETLVLDNNAFTAVSIGAPSGWMIQDVWFGSI